MFSIWFYIHDFICLEILYRTGNYDHQRSDHKEEKYEVCNLYEKKPVDVLLLYTVWCSFIFLKEVSHEIF